MTKLADDLTFPIPCPHCGHEVQESLARIKDNPAIECAACGRTFEIASESSVENAANKLDEIDRLLDGFGKS